METLDIGSMNREKALALIRLIGLPAMKDILAQADTTEKEATELGIIFKSAADATDIPPEVDDALLALYAALGNDWDAVVSRLSAPVAAEQKRSNPSLQHTPGIGALVQKKNFNPSTDFLSRALGADQVKP